MDALEAESKVALEKLEPFIRNYILDFELGMLKLNAPPWRGLKENLFLVVTFTKSLVLLLDIEKQFEVKGDKILYREPGGIHESVTHKLQVKTNAFVIGMNKIIQTHLATTNKGECYKRKPVLHQNLMLL